MLQHVYKEMSGVYSCMAHNIEGDGTSNPMTLNIRCKMNICYILIVLKYVSDKIDEIVDQSKHDYSISF